MRAMREHLGGQAGLTAPQYTFLMAVMELSGERKKGVAMRELAHYLQVTPAFVTHESNILIRLQLIVKEGNPQDRRSTLLSLSDEGARLVAALLPEVKAVNDLFFSRLTAPAFKRAQELMTLLLDGSEQAMGHVASRRVMAGMKRGGRTLPIARKPVRTQAG
jgi:DNA-binding MarR family transcriptional regulator